MSRRRWLGPALWVLGGGLLAAAWLAPDLLARYRADSGPFAEMPADCDPTRSACVAAFEDGSEVRLEVRTSTLPERRRAYALTVRASPELDPDTIDLSGVNMMSGLFRLPLERSGDGWRAITELPRCTMKEMRWRADVVLADRTARFAFSTHNSGGEWVDGRYVK